MTDTAVVPFIDRALGLAGVGSHLDQTVDVDRCRIPAAATALLGHIALVGEADDASRLVTANVGGACHTQHSGSLETDLG
eukprot:m.8698 g.8698  ORF g.8698 m.8698 type:complete len:80 (+) comp4089_c0_seq1:1996-2235(+)